MIQANTERATSRGILAFIAIAYALSVALSLLIGLTGGHESALIPLSYLSMFLPAFAVLLVATASSSASAQSPYPSKPVRIISIFAPGGGNDVICRLVAQKLSERFKQQVYVENRVGANGIIGSEAAARSPPDGYTITLIPSGHAVNASMYRKLPFD